MPLAAAIKSRAGRFSPRLGEFLSLREWRAGNRDRLTDEEPDAERLRSLVDRLRRDGVVVAPFEEVFGSRELFDRLSGDAEGRAARFRAEGGAADPAKPFRLKPHDQQYDVGDPYADIALHPDVLAVANAYMGMRTLLRAIDVWLTIPTPGPATETQLWHRDHDDRMNVKLFVYLREVTEAEGPFCYAPGTHPLGSRKGEPPRRPDGRSEDDQFATFLTRDDWVVCAGPPGTVVLADTCGWHKQLKPAGGERLLMLSHYTSGTPNAPRSFELGVPEGAELTVDQHYAVAATP